MYKETHLNIKKTTDNKILKYTTQISQKSHGVMECIHIS